MLGLTRASAEVAEADRQRLREVGLSERDIWDVAFVAAFFNKTKRMESAVDMSPNAEYHARAR